ncbi:MAG: serine/threonine protein kinase [Planctomycetes bacterium]|nr:serine/threonine protein kinase [Planctomycetota bacterium]
MEDVLSSYGIELLERTIGEGGSAIVHKGRIIQRTNDAFPEEGTPVAVKEYKSSILAIPNQLDRIRQEGALGEQINHPNVVKVYGSHIPTTDDEKCYLFMEWVEGVTLDCWASNLRKNAAWDKLKSICENILSGLSELHSKNVTHRDIKPENVMVVNDVAKVMDLGVAQITDDNEHTLHTPLKEFVGTVRYASPQFIRGEEFDRKDDVYSLGATYLELLSGRRPYHDVERKPVLPFVALLGPPNVAGLRENVPSAMKILIEGALNHDRARRPTLDEVGDALRKGGQSSYVKREIQRKATDQRAYRIVEMDATGGGFFADLESEAPELGEEYTVVRKGDPVHVPSLNTKVDAEMWIASAELRHVHQSLGHFKLTGERWVAGRGVAHAMRQLSGEGHWEDYRAKTVQVAPGDFVLKKTI